MSSTDRGSKLRRDTSLFIINRDTLRNHAGVKGGQHSFGEFQRDQVPLASRLFKMRDDAGRKERLGRQKGTSYLKVVVMVAFACAQATAFVIGPGLGLGCIRAFCHRGPPFPGFTSTCEIFEVKATGGALRASTHTRAHTHTQTKLTHSVSLSLSLTHTHKTYTHAHTQHTTYTLTLTNA